MKLKQKERMIDDLGFEHKINDFNVKFSPPVRTSNTCDDKAYLRINLFKTTVGFFVSMILTSFYLELLINQLKLPQDYFTIIFNVTVVIILAFIYTLIDKTIIKGATT